MYEYDIMQKVNEFLSTSKNKVRAREISCDFASQLVNAAEI